MRRSTDRQKAWESEHAPDGQRRIALVQAEQARRAAP